MAGIILTQTMNDLLFAIIAVAATVAFLVGIVSGIWPILVVSGCFALLFLWAADKVSPRR